ncbi:MULTISPECIES: SemiSWEET transporter [unclassified Agarivorans]|uniref:SemiSWEET transporter n=1 Tax=unclassified Agarivorans TaxID=2636026 RepID=UPI0026E388FF|nr:MULTISPECIES: SemiSWEET transporter [unclassified Agarivorans]MDO6686152.1 SemiSWEET transporter [Agarivorans sp. 3_MG-2023]MDO6716399.1 SemiSWEET transporter [Agarivorans sp. 2_MG-2023]MDO6764683.1 SemiSWEET transporter [Agarivorans sp. 1_MG-2023]
MTALTVLGLIAAACTTFSFVPQVLQIIKTKNVSGISLSMYSILTTGVGLWMLYGFLIQDLAVFVANVITFILASWVLILTIIQRVRATKNQSKR